MKKTYINLLKKFLGLFSVAAIVATMAFATPVPAKFFTSSFDASVGQTIDFDLKIEGSVDKPVYTIISNLEYDKNLLTFQGATYQPGWIPVTPDEVTDTGNGVIKRSAGYPAGLKTLASIVKYTFVTKATGQAKVNIIGSSAYDADNNDLGLQNKSITINIGGKQDTTKDQVATTPVKESIDSKKITQTITLEYLGNVGVAQNKDLSFVLKHNFSVSQDTKGTTTLSIFDVNGNEVVKDEKPFASKESFDLPVTIAANTLQPGNYSIVATSKYDNQKTATRISKDIGVVESSKEIIKETNEVAIIPFYIWIIIGILSLILLFVLIYNRSKKFKKFIKNF